MGRLVEEEEDLEEDLCFGCGALSVTVSLVGPWDLDVWDLLRAGPPFRGFAAAAAAADDKGECDSTEPAVARDGSDSNGCFFPGAVLEDGPGDPGDRLVVMTEVLSAFVGVRFSFPLVDDGMPSASALLLLCASSRMLL